MRAAVLGLATLVAGAFLLSDTPSAHACGCLSPPAVSEGAFAVNQQSEQIIFEVEPGWVTAHVMIQYAGDPASFAWIVPVPEVPEIGLSSPMAFALLDQATAPRISVTLDDICPVSEWSCAYHDQPSCGGDSASGFADGGFASDAGAAGGGGGVTVIGQQTVGDYETVTFRASEAAAATQWLRDNGFVVNQTTSIYMESYVQQNMVFVAAKLVPGAGATAIKPIKLRYRAAFPTVPLILTAVAAEPHLTVTSYVYGTDSFRPQGHPIVTVDTQRIAADAKGRVNYPMVLARTIDEAGGDAFALEYASYAPVPDVNQYNYCCSSGYDSCGLGGNGQCECPLAEFDTPDCKTTPDEVNEGLALLTDLASRYTYVSRLTTRVSAEEMTFDPAFEPSFGQLTYGPLYINAVQPSLASCEAQVLDQPALAKAQAEQSCATMYCGSGGSCVVTPSGAACACDASFVAQRFTDLDGKPSVTCVPRVPPVDLRANGEPLPDACIGQSCGAGTCIDRNGVAVCECNAGAAARPGDSLPTCESIVIATSTPGAQDYSDALGNLDVCAPAPPTCGSGGWLVHTGSTRPGVDCGNTDPSFAQTLPGPAPTCGNSWASLGCGCSAPGTPPVSSFVAVGFVGFLVLRRRSRGRRR